MSNLVTVPVRVNHEGFVFGHKGFATFEFREPLDASTWSTFWWRLGLAWQIGVANVIRLARKKAQLDSPEASAKLSITLSRVQSMDLTDFSSWQAKRLSART